METRSWQWYDKSKWGEGPWQQEADKLQWTDLDTGLPCLIVRNRVGSLCGYVGVAKDHRYYEVGYLDIDQVEAHGGLTFADKCSEDKEHGVCHQDAGDGPRWWLGFDCSHSGDLSPGMDERFRVEDTGDTYKNIHYVQNNCRMLAAQLAPVVPRGTES